MRSIGVRELRQRASEYLRDVERGETIQVTDRGRPIAVLAPIRDASPIERLIDERRATPAAADLLELGPPLKPGAGAKLPSQALAEARERER